MLYTVLCTFRPGGLTDAKEHRLEHYEFLRKVRDTIVEGGPLLGPDEKPAAMLLVVDRDSIEAAHDFISSEPYTSQGLFESVVIRKWSQVIPEPAPNFIETEYEKERSLRAPPSGHAA